MCDKNSQVEMAERIAETARRVDALINAATYAEYVEQKPAGLTYDRLLETFRSVPKAPPPLRVFEVPLYAVKVQARRHPRKKRRLQKKWLTRYGYRTEYRRHFEPGQMLVDKSRGIVYAHREEIDAMKLRMPEPEGWQHHYGQDFGRF